MSLAEGLWDNHGGMRRHRLSSNLAQHFTEVMICGRNITEVLGVMVEGEL